MGTHDNESMDKRAVNAFSGMSIAGCVECRSYLKREKASAEM